MPEGDSYVANGDLLRCDKGVLLMPLTVLPRPSKVHGRYQATTLDCLPIVNIKPFGVCAITHGPCLPPMLLWTQAHSGGRLVGGAPPLLESSVCQCGLGGRISITVLPVPGMAPVGPEAPGALAMAQEQQRQQAAQDAAAHELANHAKEQAGKLALLGIACAIGGLFFPPLELVAVVALEASEMYLVAGVGIDLAVAIDHPTQDNWVTVGGDVVAVALGYVVGKVVVGRIVSSLAKAEARQVANLPKTAQAVEEAVTAVQATAAAEAKKAAYEAAQDIFAKTSKRKMPRAVTVLVDKLTGKKYIGASKGVTDAATLETSTAARLPAESLEEWTTHNCAEVDALNKAIKDGAKPENLVQHTVKIERQTGEITDYARCKNCQITTHDIPTPSDH